MGRNSGGVTGNGRKRSSSEVSRKRQITKLINADTKKLASAQRAFDSHVWDYMSNPNGSSISFLRTKKMANAYATRMMNHYHQETTQAIKMRINRYKKMI